MCRVTSTKLDYLITPELGGTTEAADLWPERYTGSTWNARVKDHLELLLPRMVCTGEVDLPTAQRDIARNWVAAYRKYLPDDRTAHRLRRDELAPPRHIGHRRSTHRVARGPMRSAQLKNRKFFGVLFISTTRPSGNPGSAALVASTPSVSSAGVRTSKAPRR